MERLCTLRVQESKARPTSLDPATKWSPTRRLAHLFQKYFIR